MPLQIEDYSQTSAKSELVKAGIAGAWLGISTEMGGRIIGKATGMVGGLFVGTKPLRPGPLVRGAYQTAKFGVNVAARGLRMAGGMFSGGIIAGGVRTATGTASWLYRHPVATVGLAAGAGLALGGFDPRERMTNEQYMSPGVVEAMGGTSNAGVNQLMDVMNASGNVTLGLHARR